MSREDEDYIGELLEQSGGDLSDMVLGVRADGRLYYASASIEKVLGYSDRDFLRLYNHNLEYADDQRFAVVRQFVLRQLNKLQTEMQTGYVCEPESLAVNHRDGFRVTLSVQCIPSVDEEHKLRGAVCVCRDISKRNSRVDDTALSSAVFENRMFGIYVTDGFGKVVQVNSTFSRITGFEAGEVLGNTLNLIDVQRYSPEFYQNMRDRLEVDDYWEGEIQHRNKDGHVFNAWVELRALRDTNGKIINTVGYLTDLSEPDAGDDRLQRLAFFDPLTGLPNRSLFGDRLSQALIQSRRRNNALSLLVLDLCGFRKLNERAGHNVGDALIEQVGKRLVDQVRAEDTVARIGSDRFAVILADLPDVESAGRAAMQVAEKLDAAMRQSFTVNGREIFSPADMGISCFPADGNEPQTLLKRAEHALLHVRQRGEAGFQFYSPCMQAKAETHMASEKELFEAYRRGEFELHYQPLLSADGSEIKAYEALLRWRHPQRGLLPAAEFIHLVEETGLIQPLGNWVLRQACEQWRIWSQNSTAGAPAVSVNLSPKQLKGHTLVKTLNELLAQHQISPGALQLEMHERMLVDDGQLLDCLDELKRLGVVVLVDGFGAGNSCLTCLNRMPVDGIKIDHGLIESLDTGEELRMVKAIVALARTLDLSVTAAGIETADQLQMARELGCDLVQGYLLDRQVQSFAVPAFV